MWGGGGLRVFMGIQILQKGISLGLYLGLLRTCPSCHGLLLVILTSSFGLSEKEGGGNRPTAQMVSFLNIINWCGFHDLRFVGPKFTWLYQRKGRHSS